MKDPDIVDDRGKFLGRSSWYDEDGEKKEEFGGPPRESIPALLGVVAPEEEISDEEEVPVVEVKKPVTRKKTPKQAQ